MHQLPVINTAKTGKRINQLMISAGMSVHDLQSRCGLGSSQAIYKWLNGKSLPAIETLVILSDIFDVSIESILQIDQ